MPECVVCGLDDFEERDGLFFCTTCQTQTQDLIVEEEEFEEQGETGQVIVDKRLQIRQRREKTAKRKEYKGRPWTIYEAYQIILKHQVNAFIRLGAHPKLEEFVFRLWAVYLSKLEVAFTENEQLYPQVLRKHVRHREKYFGSLENPITPAVRNIRYFQSRGIQKEVSSVSPATLQGEEFYKGDNPIQGAEGGDGYPSSSSSSSSEEEEAGKGEDRNSSDEEQDDYEDDNVVHEPKSSKSKTSLNRMMARRIEWVSLPKLLSLCHLGLLYTNSITTATDIVRWVEDGEIPYVEVSTLLPDEFQFGSYDPQLFSAQIPKPHALRKLTGDLAYFLDITHLPPISVSQLISRYILLLELPAEFHGLVMSVMSLHPPQDRFVIKSAGMAASLPFYDGLALGYIIITLKLWFGLDDTTEKELSVYTRDVMELIEGKHDLFVFEDWKVHITRKLASINEKTSLFSAGGIIDGQNIDSLLDSYYKSNHHRRRPPRYYQTAGGNNRYHQSTKEDLALPFKLAAEKMKKVSDLSKGQGQSQSQDESEDSTNRKKFSTCSMKHITNPDTFLDDLDRHGLSDDTIYSSCFESDDDNDGQLSVYSGMESMSIDSFDNSFSKPKPKRPKSAAKEAVRKVFSKMQSGKKHVSEEFQTKMANLRKKCICASKHFIVYKRILRKDMNCSLEAYRHKSYCWVVNLCSRIVRCTPYEMDTFVLLLSFSLFNFSSQRVNLTPYQISNFRKKYFACVESEDCDDK